MTRKKHGNCPRCGMLSRKKLCDQLGLHDCFILTIEELVKQWRERESSPTTILDRLEDEVKFVRDNE